MSNIANPYGFSHQQKIGGKPRHYTFKFPLEVTTGGAGYAGSLGAGDPVAFLGNSNVIGIPTVPAGATTQATLGTFLNVTYTDVYGAIVQNTYWAANTAVKPGTVPICTVDCDPYVVWQVQCNAAFSFGSAAAALVGAAGRNFNYIAGTPNANTKTSTYALNVSGGSGKEEWRNCTVIGLAQIPNNTWTDLFPDVLVVFNNHKLKQGTLGTQA